MAIRFKLMARKNPQKPEDPPKYYAQVVPSAKINLKTLSQRVSSHTTMSAPDVYGVLMALEEEIIASLKEGAQVELGNLCIFYPDLKSEGAESEDAFNAGSHIKRKSIRVRPKQALSRQMENVPVEKIS